MLGELHAGAAMLRTVQAGEHTLRHAPRGELQLLDPAYNRRVEKRLRQFTFVIQGNFFARELSAAKAGG